MFHKRCCVNIFIFGKVLKGGLMKKLINLASWVGYKQGEVNNACRQAWNHEVIETFSSFIHYSHRHNKGPVRGKIWWDSTVPNPSGFLHVVLSQVLYSLFATSIQAAPGSYCSSSPILPTMFHLLHGPQPDTASLVDQSVPSLFSSFFSPFSPSCFQFSTGLSPKSTCYHAWWWKWRGLQDSWGIQDPAFASGTWNCTRAAFGCLAFKTKIDKKDKNTRC